jgi:hypothetical protein
MGLKTPLRRSREPVSGARFLAPEAARPGLLPLHTERRRVLAPKSHYPAVDNFVDKQNLTPEEVYVKSIIPQQDRHGRKGFPFIFNDLEK